MIGNAPGSRSESRRILRYVICPLSPHLFAVSPLFQRHGHSCHLLPSITYFLISPDPSIFFKRLLTAAASAADVFPADTEHARMTGGVDRGQSYPRGQPLLHPGPIQRQRQHHKDGAAGRSLNQGAQKLGQKSAGPAKQNAGCQSVAYG